MHRLSIAAALALACLAPAPAAGSWLRLRDLAAATPTQAVGTGALFVVSGHGWGHGVGMSQYGAFGYAQRGWTHQRIVAHYFPGTTLGQAPVARVRVLLGSGKKTVTVASPVPFKVRDASGDVHDLAAGSQAFGPGLKLKLAGQDKKAEQDGKAEQDKKKALPGPLTFLPGGAPLQLGRRYRGSVQVEAVGGRLRVINVVGLEAYLYGVVPSEMPHRWHPEALKAQAVVARSYALAVRRSGPFDLYPDQRSQVYLGVDHEFPETSAAVDATAGQVALYEGTVAKTYFFSTSGGRTASSADIWGGTVPYLVAVPDPYDSISPYHDWGPYAYSGGKLAGALDVAGPVTDAEAELNGSGRVASLTVTTPRGSRSILGSDVRRRLGLRSTWFTVGALALNPPAGPVVYGSTLQLTGTARGLQQIDLQQRAGGAAWRTIAHPRPAKDGTLTVKARPLAPSDFRLATRTFATGRVRVGVAPLVRFNPDVGPGELRGLVKPALPGATVTVQRLEGDRWRSVGRAPVDVGGTFVATLDLVSGSYRARAVVGHGFAPGTTPVLKVSTP